MSRAGLALTLLALIPCPARAAAPPSVADQWIVAHAPGYREALTPLIEHRRAQGLRVVIVPCADRDGSRLQAQLRQLCRAHRGPSSILLVGAPHLRLESVEVVRTAGVFQPWEASDHRPLVATFRLTAPAVP